MNKKGAYMEYELHPLCTLFPRMDGSAFDSLVADIAANGLREPIIVHEGMILDGGNRYRACIAAGVEPTTMKFGGGSLVGYVLSANLHRRHLSPGQQAAIVASAQDWANAQQQGGTGVNQHTKEQTGNVTGLQTVKDRAAISGASDKTQRNADKVAKTDPELAKRVAHGEISLPKAVEQITGKSTTQAQSEAPNESDFELERLHETIEILQDENERLANLLAARTFEGNEEDRTAFLNRMDELVAENKRLHILNHGLTVSRDKAMAENNAMRGQLRMNARKLKAAA